MVKGDFWKNSDLKQFLVDQKLQKIANLSQDCHQIHLVTFAVSKTFSSIKNGCELDQLSRTPSKDISEKINDFIGLG